MFMWRELNPEQMEILPYIKNKKELVITKTIISKYPSFISLYETYKNEINKILEVEN